MAKFPIQIARAFTCEMQAKSGDLSQVHTTNPDVKILRASLERAKMPEKQVLLLCGFREVRHGFGNERKL